MAITNVLHNYRSYSYKHILIACDTGSVAEYISSLDGQAAFNQIINQKGAGGRNPYDDSSDSDGLVLTNVANKGKYSIVINSFTDSEFYISGCKYQTLLAPSFNTKTPNKDHVTSVATEGNITIMEPRGFRFMNVVNNVGNALGCGPVAITWVLKTIFVGHMDIHNNSTVEYISDTKPFLFSLQNITAKFDEGGSRYELSVVAQANGTAKAPHFSTVNINTISVSVNDTLSTTMLKLQNLINSNYTNKINELRDQNFQELDSSTQRPILYHIHLDPQYAAADYIIDKLLTNQTGEGDITGGTISFGNNNNVEYIIREVMMKCSKVVNGANVKPNVIFKIYTMLDTDSQYANVRFVIKPMQVPEAVDPDNSQLETGTQFGLLEFDYIYTGNNVDVLDFQINMEQGLAFFQVLQSLEVAVEDQSAQHKVLKSDGATSINGPDKVNDTSIIMPIKPNKRLLSRSVKDPLSTNKFNMALSKFSSIDTLEASLTIRGNPRLLNDMNIQPSQYTNTNIVQQQEGIPNWLLTPSLCKINISMPSNNSLLGVGPNDQFQTPFWYQGLYNILAIEHSFQNGDFTQTISMKNVPQSDNTMSPLEYTQKKQTDVK